MNTTPEVTPFGELPSYPGHPAQAAEMLWSRGFEVIPFKIQGSIKRPLVKQWKPYTETLASVVSTVQRSGAFGIVVPPGLIVVDLDTSNKEGGSAYVGLDTLIDLGLDHGIESIDYLNTLTVDTPRGGMHLWYRIPPSITFRNSASKIGSGIDVRVPRDGLVLMPPSGEAGHLPYMFSPYSQVMTMPLWLMNILRNADIETKEIGREIKKIDYDLLVNRKDHSQYLERRCESVATSPQGLRNNSLNAVAYSIFRRVAGGMLDEYAAESALYSAGLRSGLRESETRATIASARRAASMSPIV